MKQPKFYRSIRKSSIAWESFCLALIGVGFCLAHGYIEGMSLHMIKLVVGVDALEDFAAIQAREVIDYEGQPAVPCWTRFQPKRADEILRSQGSLYRVIKSRIQCRQRILGFEIVETKSHGTRCKIMQDPEIITTVSTPHRPFQGWRYFDDAKVPKDRGVFMPGLQEGKPPAEMEDDLRAAGLL